MGPLKKLGHVEGGREIGTLVQGRRRGNRLKGGIVGDVGGKGLQGEEGRSLGSRGRSRAKQE